MSIEIERQNGELLLKEIQAGSSILFGTCSTCIYRNEKNWTCRITLTKDNKPALCLIRLKRLNIGSTGLEWGCGRYLERITSTSPSNAFKSFIRKSNEQRSDTSAS